MRSRRSTSSSGIGSRGIRELPATSVSTSSPTAPSMPWPSRDDVDSRAMRQIVLDVETTGLEAHAGHRIIEIGCVELLNRRPTGQKFHRYLNPEREIDAGALAVHGIEMAKLAQAPKFAEIAAELVAFIEGA